MSAPAKPMDRRLGMPGGRGRAPVLNIKCFIEAYFKQGTEWEPPRTVIHPVHTAAWGFLLKPQELSSSSNKGLDPEQPLIKLPHTGDVKDVPIKD